MTEFESQRYPLGWRTFQGIIEDGLAYVDKTDMVHSMTHGNSGFVLLARPPVFGKSVLVRTLESYFEGRRDLFRGLAIERLETEWARHPVLRFYMGMVKDRVAGNVARRLDYEVAQYEDAYGSVGGGTPGERLKRLVRRAHASTGRGVVVLVDSYDSPLTNVIDDVRALEEVREVMAGFYGSLADVAPCLRFVYLSGITRFMNDGLFPGLDMIEDISMRPEYATVCGFTMDEVLGNFMPGIKHLAAGLGITPAEVVERMRAEYDGYHFAWPSPSVLNPCCVLNVLSDMEFRNHWFRTGVGSTIARVLEWAGVGPERMAGRHVPRHVLEGTTRRLASDVPFLYQTGYLTIGGLNAEDGSYLLDFPDREVRYGLMHDLLLVHVRLGHVQAAWNTVSEVHRCLRDGDPDGALRELRAFLARAPYMTVNPTWECCLSMLYLVFNCCCPIDRTRAVASPGRLDVVSRTGRGTILIRIEPGVTAARVLRRMAADGADAPFQADGLPVARVGVGFNVARGNISGWRMDPAEGLGAPGPG